MYRYEKRESKFKRVFITILLMVFTSVASIYIYRMYAQIDVKTETNTRENVGGAVRLSLGQNEDKNISTILEEASKCVVGISKIKNKGDSILSTNATENLSLGTGTIISENGYILTNWHVVGNRYSLCYVTLEDGTTYNANTLWVDSDLDLAIIKINANNLKYLKLGDSDNIKIGDSVYAIGNPIGIEFQRTVTSGIISGIDRTLKLEENNSSSYMEGLIQTDASINQGNSGGPLINSEGEIIGINSVKIESAEGIGFAIPVNIVRPIIESFEETGGFEEAYLGIFAYDREVTKYLENNLDFNNGIYIVKIMQDGPISKTNMKIGDVITKIDGNEVNKMSELREYIYKKKPGDKVTVTYLRNNKEYNIDIILSKK